jgi:hypothetical protein
MHTNQDAEPRGLISKICAIGWILIEDLGKLGDVGEIRELINEITGLYITGVKKHCSDCLYWKCNDESGGVRSE